jgi:glycosyltransferase involved in cell wall biosynthesis
VIVVESVPSQAVLAAVFALPSINAAWNLYSTVRGLRAMVRVPETTPERGEWPKLSVIIAACNEAVTIEEATAAKLTSDYPNLELVLVDDRSSDGTSEIVDRLAREDPRVRAVHVTELPDGWLGKVNALARGYRESTGDWLLFSDADVHIESTLLRRVVALALDRDAEFVTMPPQLLSSSFVLDVIFSTFMRLLVVAGRLWKVSDPNSRASVGGGVFNLVKRSAFARSAGFEWLRMDLADDVSLGQMMKRAGARSLVLDGGDGVRLHFYRSVLDMMHGVEKNGYAVLGGLNPFRALLVAAIVLYLELAPLAALAVPSLPIRVAGAAMLALITLAQVLIARAGRRGIASALVPGLGAALLISFMLRSAVLTHLHDGIKWRGTHYSLQELRAGRRLEIF